MPERRSSKKISCTTLHLRIPETLSFEDLDFAMASTGEFTFNPDLIEQVIEASAIPTGDLRSAPGGAVLAICRIWYDQHLARGGEPNASMEFLKAEQQAIKERGYLNYHEPAWT